MRQTSGAQEPMLFEQKAVFQRKRLVDQETLVRAGFVTHKRAHPWKMLYVALLYLRIKVPCNILKILQALRYFAFMVQSFQFKRISLRISYSYSSRINCNTFSTHVKQSWGLCSYLLKGVQRFICTDNLKFHAFPNGVYLNIPAFFLILQRLFACFFTQSSLSCLVTLH